MESVYLCAGRLGVALKNRKLRYFGLFCVLLAVFASQAFAQEATIVGAVTDPTGAAVANAAITVTNAETGLATRLSSNEAGQYVVSNLRFGHYTLKVETKGFKTVEHKNIVLAVGDRLRIDIKLEVGGASESVTVEAAPVAVQTESGEASHVLTDEQVANIPANGRSIYSLVALVPGASSNMADGQVPTPVGGDATVSFNGQRQAHNIYLIDGGEDLDRGGAGTISVMPSVDAIQEFRVLSSNYSAEYGLSSAGTMTMVIKSGTKKFHASAWEFDRNDVFDAVPHNTTSKPELRFNVYGFNVGGPVDFKSKDPKTFFFYNMEWRKQVQGGSVYQHVPDTATYGGQFASSLTATNLHTPCTNQLSSTQAARFTAAGLTLSTPAPDGSCAYDSTKSAANNPVFQPFNANKIPGSLLSAQAQALLKAGIFPGNNTTDANNGNAPTFSGGNKAPTNVREEIVRADHRFSDKTSIFGHWISEQITQTFGTTMWSGDNVPSIGNTFGNPSYSAVVHFTDIISPTLLNEIAFNYNGNRINILPKGIYQIPAGSTFNRYFSGQNALNRIPSIQLATGPQTNYTANWVPWVNKADDYQLRDDVAWTKGAHQVKVGFSWALYRKTQNLFASTQGGYSFNGSYTGDSFADYLLGYSNGYNEAAIQDSGQWNNVSWAAYVQDNWHASKRLTLNLGLRWDGVPHTYEANNRMSNFYPSMYDPAKAATLVGNTSIAANSPGLGGSPTLASATFYLNGIGISGEPGVPRGMTNNHWAAFGPRIGFAYDLTGAGKTVLRGGVGIMYERIQGNDMYNGGTNVPFSASIGLSGSVLGDPKTNIAGASVSAPIPIVGITGISLNNYKLPISTQYSVGVEQALGKSVLGISYVGNQERHENNWIDINVPANPTQALLAQLANDSTSLINTLVPYKGFGSIVLAENGGTGHYNGLQVSLRGTVKSDLDYQVGYTFSKAVDSTTGNGGNGTDLNHSSNPYNFAYDVGPSILDRRHILTANYLYKLPFLRNSSNHLARTTLGGWALSGVVAMQSGIPLNITLGGTYGANGLPNATNRPDLTGSISYPKKASEWFNTSAFAQPAQGAWGNLHHNVVRGPGRDNWNMALIKDFLFSEERGSHLEFRAEFFNVWNHTQFNGIGTQFQGFNTNGTPKGNFGEVTSYYNPRQLQLGLKLSF